MSYNYVCLCLALSLNLSAHKVSDCVFYISHEIIQQEAKVICLRLHQNLPQLTSPRTVWGLGPHLVQCALGLQEFPAQTAPLTVQPFFAQCSKMTERQTNTPCYRIIRHNRPQDAHCAFGADYKVKSCFLYYIVLLI